MNPFVGFFLRNVFLNTSTSYTIKKTYVNIGVTREVFVRGINGVEVTYRSVIALAPQKNSSDL